MRRLSALALLFALGPANTAGAQVLEIDGAGELTTYDQPMVFTSLGAAPINSPRRHAAVDRSSSAQPLWPLVDAQARQHGLPPSLLRAVAWQESRGRQTAVSRKGALGVMQLMPGTAAAMGVDPTDPHDNLRGGAMYLKRQIDHFGSVPLALAAYNAGPAAVARFGGVPPYRETRAYVAAILSHWQPEAADLPFTFATGVPPT